MIESLVLKGEYGNFQGFSKKRMVAFENLYKGVDVVAEFLDGTQVL